MSKKQTREAIVTTFPGLRGIKDKSIHIYKSTSRGSRMERVLKGIPAAKSILQKCGTTTRKIFILVRENPGGHYPNTTAPKKTTTEKSEDDSQFSEIFRCFQEVLEQRDVQPVFVNVDFEEICHQAARAKKVLVLALFYPGNNDEHMARLLKCLAQFKSIYLWIDNAKSQTGRQVKTTFGRKAPVSELMILTPKPNDPCLNVCFSAKIAQGLIYSVESIG
nr:uncharacterized protein LOC131793419 [Pocillopora verrucosa]